MTSIQLHTLSNDELWDIVASSLHENRRTLTSDQEKAVKKALVSFPSPLYARILAKECCSCWSSSTNAPTLASNVVALFEDKLQVKV